MFLVWQERKIKQEERECMEIRLMIENANKKKIPKIDRPKIRTCGKNRFRWKYGKKIRVPRRK